jgi:5'-phosphate synthase pdxT subunit
VTNPAQFSFNAMGFTAARNAYGSQLDSFHARINDYAVAFIRAPKFVEVDAAVHVAARHDGEPVWLQHKNVMVTSFHPELTADYPSPFHRAFAQMIN